MGYSDKQLLSFDPFEGDRDVDIRMRSARIVTVRKTQRCYGLTGHDQHDVEPGSRARFEKALVDGKWGKFYMCVGCVERWLRDYCDEEPDNAD